MRVHLPLAALSLAICSLSWSIGKNGSVGVNLPPTGSQEMLSANEYIQPNPSSINGSTRALPQQTTTPATPQHSTESEGKVVLTKPKVRGASLPPAQQHFTWRKWCTDSFCCYVCAPFGTGAAAGAVCGGGCIGGGTLKLTYAAFGAGAYGKTLGGVVAHVITWVTGVAGASAAVAGGLAATGGLIAFISLVGYTAFIKLTVIRHRKCHKLQWKTLHTCRLLVRVLAANSLIKAPLISWKKQ